MSTNERDELAEVLHGQPIHGPYAMTHINMTEAAEIADELIAAGYRKPRTITTVEELDTLPIGSVVLSEAYHSDVDGTAISFQRWYDGDWHRGARSGSTHPDNFLPATVLHEPEPQP